MVMDTPDQNKTNPSTPPALTMVELTSLINRYLADIDQIKEKYKGQKQMFDDTFGNDPQYRELAEKAKQATKVKSARKQILTKQPALQPVISKMNELKDEIKNLEETLSSYVSEYQRQTGATVFEGEQGQMMRIVRVYKLVRTKEE